MRVGDKLVSAPPPPTTERETQKPVPPKPQEKAQNPAHLGNKVDTEA
jgi:hypothetical protein